MDRCLLAAATLAQQVAMWEQARTTRACPVDWRFTTPEARLKRKRPTPKSARLKY